MMADDSSSIATILQLFHPLAPTYTHGLLSSLNFLMVLPGMSSQLQTTRCGSRPSLT